MVGFSPGPQAVELLLSQDLPLCQKEISLIFLESSVFLFSTLTLYSKHIIANCLISSIFLNLKPYQFCLIHLPLNLPDFLLCQNYFNFNFNLFVPFRSVSIKTKTSKVKNNQSGLLLIEIK